MSILTLQLDRNPQRIAKAVDLASREATSFREFPITGPQCSRAHRLTRPRESHVNPHNPGTFHLVVITRRSDPT
ncbi:protein of unknown function (plasmid) [Cupriavidus taiwanensis]|nr:hypothetical protein CBM2597_U20058 [Cupriavidus taiwanensis]SOZ96788.1 hypothetical protein CBM2598_U20065 [Cupriavidus taiwanensis]SPD37929.1 protein of unknown function [Cupriavidus taiwanensis]